MRGLLVRPQKLARFADSVRQCKESAIRQVRSMRSCGEPVMRFVIVILTFVLVVSGCTTAHAEFAAGEEIERRVEALEQQLREIEAERDRDRKKIEVLEEELELLRAGENANETAAPATASVSVADQLNVFNPRITVFGNALLRVDDRKVFLREDGERERIDDQFNLREVELDLRAAIDPYADGVVIVALESEVPGEFEVGVEEGYAIIKTLPFWEAPPLGLKLKAGRFRPAFGRFNQLHTHDLPQSTRPLAVEAFLGREGFIASGGAARILLPSVLDVESAWELTGQLVQGGEIAVAEGGTHKPAYLANLRWSRTFDDHHFADISGIFYAGKSAGTGPDAVQVYSLDCFYKWKPLRGGEWRSFLLGGQLFFSERKFEGRKNSPFGYFVFGQYQLNRRLFAGVRWDWTQDVDDDDLERMDVYPCLTYYFSEFLRLRLGWEHHWSDVSEEDGLDTLLGELNFVFGSHPPEPFWVNR